MCAGQPDATAGHQGHRRGLPRRRGHPRRRARREGLHPCPRPDRGGARGQPDCPHLPWTRWYAPPCAASAPTARRCTPSTPPRRSRCCSSTSHADCSAPGRRRGPTGWPAAATAPCCCSGLAGAFRRREAKHNITTPAQQPAPRDIHASIKPGTDSCAASGFAVAAPAWAGTPNKWRTRRCAMRRSAARGGPPSHPPRFRPRAQTSGSRALITVGIHGR